MPRRELGTRALKGAFASFDGALDFLWSNLDGRDESRVDRVWFAGPEGGEGTTTVAACAALGIADHLRERVVLLEANVRRPALARYLGLPPEPGLAELVRGEATLEESVRSTEVPGLSVVPAGAAEGMEPGDLATDAAANWLARIAASARYVLIDAPAVLPYAEARLLLRHADRAVLVVRARETARRDAVRARELVDAAGVPVIGSVVNRYRPELPGWMERRGWS